MVKQLYAEAICFLMHHVADAEPSEASTLWILVITSSVQLACSLAVQMLVPICVSAMICSNLRSADGLNPIFGSAVFENCEHGYPADCSCVPEKEEAGQEFDEEVEMVGGTLEDAVYGSPKRVATLRKKSGRTSKEDTSKATQFQSKGNTKAKPSGITDPEAATFPFETHASKKAEIGFQAWKDDFNGTKKN